MTVKKIDSDIRNKVEMNLKNNDVKNIDVIKNTIINSPSGLISMDSLVENFVFLKSVDGGLTAQVIEAVARHQKELYRLNAMNIKFLSLRYPSLKSEASNENDIDYQERWLVTINAYEEEISKIRSLLQEPFWIESNEKPIICPFYGFSPSVLFMPGNSNKYLYKDCLYYADGLYTEEEKKLLIMENFDQERRKFERLKNKHEYSDDTKYQRPNIPESVRIIVWKRDSGKCVKCGSRENLEYDHIIPISKGGSNTARNIELLCENCNRSKGAKIE